MPYAAISSSLSQRNYAVTQVGVVHYWFINVQHFVPEKDSSFTHLEVALI